ncbi:MAG: hypothetical protein J7J96_02815 [Sulfurimonas sp.]|nr:hypothetical protein [Sulfurimonas sp.]
MKNLQLLAISLALVLFSACSSKRVYEPESVVSSWGNQGGIQSPIVDVTSDVALLENRKVLTTTKILDVQVDESYRLLATTDGWVISSTIDGKLKLQYIDDSNLIENFQLKKTIAGASVKDDILAVLFADNEMALYSIASKELLLREQGGDIIAVDSRIVNPYFMNDLVMFATLDGKIVVLNSKSKKKLRTVIVSSEDNFNNVIYFNILDNKIIVATAYKILSMGKKEVREKYEIRNVTNDGNNIFITTKQGDIVSLTSNLQLNAKLKFPFAHFLGLIVKNDKLYALEKEGYLIVAPTDLSNFEVYDVGIDKGFVFVSDKTFFVDDEYISVE